MLTALLWVRTWQAPKTWRRNVDPNPMTTRKKIILDCDPGHDDAVALLLAHGNPDIELLAVTTVVGNQTLEKSRATPSR